MEKECILTHIKPSTFVKNITVFSILLGFVICVLFVVFNAFFVGDQIFLRGTTFSTQNIFISLLIIAFGPFIIGLDIAILSFIFCILNPYHGKPGFKSTLVIRARKGSYHHFQDFHPF